MAQRLQKIIAAAGLASRRQAERMIVEGRVTVNGQVVRKLGTRANLGVDFVKVDGKRVQAEALEYYALNKPAGCISSVSDPQGRPVAVALIKSLRRLYPVGRLDYQSEGLLIVTNDGDLTRRMTQAGRVDKVYRVKVRGLPNQETLAALRRGGETGRAVYAPCRLRVLKKDANCWLEVILRQGKNRQIRRMFRSVGHPVMRLKRIAVGPVRLEGLNPGAYRRLTPQEVAALKGEP